MKICFFIIQGNAQKIETVNNLNGKANPLRNENIFVVDLELEAVILAKHQVRHLGVKISNVEQSQLTMM